ncbi:protein valois [Sitodiplosis mosellana]|uniref:protein valois n=1 Tax=Sitodiplosis mosellana TaxID=263140 RepID=UPI0024440F58|nr:protein valois [Sitodiplosis mosellana]
MNAEFSEYFKAPSNYSEPHDTELDGSTQFPNLNSIEFRSRKNDDGVALLPFYELLEANEDQSIILLATNSYNQRLWNGAVFGYGKFDDIGKPNTGIIKLPFDSNVTGIGWTGKTMVVFTTATGTIQFWSLQSEIRQQNGYNLFQVSKKTEHFGLISGFTLFDGDKKDKAVTGSTDGCLKIWKLGACDIISEQTYRYAHKAAITGVSSKPNSDDLFATTSRDHSLSIWDLRSKMPLVNCFKNEDFANTACLWAQPQNNGVDNLFVGEDSGKMHILDPRKLNEYVVTQTLFERPIYKFRLSPSKKSLCILGQTNTLKVVSMTTGAETIYTDSTACDYVRDVCWINNQNDAQQSFYSIGWSKNVGQHSIKESSTSSSQAS